MCVIVYSPCSIVLNRDKVHLNFKKIIGEGIVLAEGVLCT